MLILSDSGSITDGIYEIIVYAARLTFSFIGSSVPANISKSSRTGQKSSNPGLLLI